ncbi:MAG: biotin transporter BioY [Thermotogota bacterium]
MYKTRQLIITALMTALTAVCAQIVIPIGTVPVTMQTFMVFLSGMILGPFWGTISQIAYLLLGLFGLPVFAMFSSGLAILAGPTGGFLLAFPFVALLTGADKDQSKYVFRFFALLLLYTSGWIRLSLFTGDLLTAFFSGVLPFIGFDLLKVWGAGFVHKQLKYRLLFLD